jgi:hypothetical protein
MYKTLTNKIESNIDHVFQKDLIKELIKIGEFFKETLDTKTSPKIEYQKELL